MNEILSFFSLGFKGVGGRSWVCFCWGRGDMGRCPRKYPPQATGGGLLRRNFWQCSKVFPGHTPKAPFTKPHCSPPHFSGPPTHGLAVLPSQKCLLFCSVRLPWGSLICSWLLWCQGARKPGPTWSPPSLASHSRCLSRERSVHACKHPGGPGVPGTALWAKDGVRPTEDACCLHTAPIQLLRPSFCPYFYSLLFWEGFPHFSWNFSFSFFFFYEGWEGKTYVFMNLNLILKINLDNKWQEFSFIDIFRGSWTNQPTLDYVVTFSSPWKSEVALSREDRSPSPYILSAELPSPRLPCFYPQSYNSHSKAILLKPTPS